MDAENSLQPKEATSKNNRNETQLATPKPSSTISSPAPVELERETASVV
jgi:hypothetical protein